jgi:hypothetical protein
LIARGAAAFLFSALACVAVFSPADLRPISAGLDTSWASVLGEAPRLGLKFGRDIIFTGGPLSPLYTGYFAEATIWWVVGFRALTILVIAAGLVLLTLRSQLLVLVPVAFVILFLFPDGVFFLVPFLLVLVIADAPRSFARRLYAVACALVCAALTLAKFSVAPLALVCLALVDLLTLRARRLPVAIGVYVTGVVALFAVLQGGLASFGPFLASTLDVTAGYAEGMSSVWPTEEIAYFLIAALIGIVTVLRVEFSLVRAGRVDGWTAAALVVATVGYLYVVFKAGFVRHDLHAVIGWSGFAVAASAYVLLRWQLSDAKTSLIALQAVALALVVLLVPRSYKRGIGMEAPAFWSFIRQQPFRSADATVRLLAAPGERLRQLQAARDHAMQELRAAHPMPRLAGAVDIIPSKQSLLIAHGLDYRPRFTVQEYTTYTDVLIERNRAFFRGERAPANLLFQPGSIDRRYPALAEGPLWPDFLRLYDPVDLVGDMLLLRRRAQPAGDVLGVATAASVDADVPFALPPGPLFLKARFDLTLFGILANLALKPPLVHMRVTFADGETAQYRLIPAIARQGFIVSPLIEQASDFALLAAGTVSRTMRPVTSIAFELTGLGRRAYRRPIAVELFPLDVTRIPPSPARDALVRRLAGDS